MSEEKVEPEISNIEITNEKTIPLNEENEPKSNIEKEQQEEIKPKKKIKKRAPIEKTIDDCMKDTNNLIQEGVSYYTLLKKFYNRIQTKRLLTIYTKN